MFPGPQFEDDCVSMTCCLCSPSSVSSYSSWTEDTRSCIFSDSALHYRKDGETPLAAELDLQIEQRFEEFEELAATGKNILAKDHHLTQMVRVTHLQTVILDCVF